MTVMTREIMTQPARRKALCQPRNQKGRKKRSLPELKKKPEGTTQERSEGFGFYVSSELPPFAAPDRTSQRLGFLQKNGVKARELQEGGHCRISECVENCLRSWKI
ncbi:MAG: hypothetical protein AAF555_11250 [Verrucomicrobiota bacterium]